jgi:hypothetical protein
MCNRRVIVHCPSRLGAAVTDLAVELSCGDRVSTEWTLERAKPVHHCDGVVSHTFKCSRSPMYNAELKLPLPLLVRSQNVFPVP